MHKSSAKIVCVNSPPAPMRFGGRTEHEQRSTLSFSPGNIGIEIMTVQQSCSRWPAVRALSAALLCILISLSWLMPKGIYIMEDDMNLNFRTFALADPSMWWMPNGPIRRLTWIKSHLAVRRPHLTQHLANNVFVHTTGVRLKSDLSFLVNIFALVRALKTRVVFITGRN